MLPQDHFLVQPGLCKHLPLPSMPLTKISRLMIIHTECTQVRDQKPSENCEEPAWENALTKASFFPAFFPWKPSAGAGGGAEQVPLTCSWHPSHQCFAHGSAASFSLNPAVSLMLSRLKYWSCPLCGEIASSLCWNAGSDLFERHMIKPGSFWGRAGDLSIGRPGKGPCSGYRKHKTLTGMWANGGAQARITSGYWAHTKTQVSGSTPHPRGAAVEHTGLHGKALAHMEMSCPHHLSQMAQAEMLRPR